MPMVGMRCRRLSRIKYSWIGVEYLVVYQFFPLVPLPVITFCVLPVRTIVTTWLHYSDSYAEPVNVKNGLYHGTLTAYSNLEMVKAFDRHVHVDRAPRCRSARPG